MVEPAKDELRLLPHVGAKVADAMREAGLYTIEDVASASVDTLSAVPGLGRKRAATVKQAAVDLLDDRNEEEAAEEPEREPEAYEGDAPWERQPGERAKHYRWFTVYLELGPERTLLAAYRQVMPHRKRRDASSGWKRAARQWDWQGRAEAWDARRRE